MVDLRSTPDALDVRCPVSVDHDLQRGGGVDDYSLKGDFSYLYGSSYGYINAMYAGPTYNNYSGLYMEQGLHLNTTLPGGIIPYIPSKNARCSRICLYEGDIEYSGEGERLLGSTATRRCTSSSVDQTPPWAPNTVVCAYDFVNQTAYWTDIGKAKSGLATSAGEDDIWGNV